ncbi:hypothetical protein D9758_003500 [Tetrapyrgos nigripes]|uniref:Glucose-methanol-choline oxidoreductase N-terminal domain-containing protein n=1 Tax=Tetrapyrgos nigripes TaxID=182062 RepID=A0A8H5GVL1_9AGAR|nr:hypothetical protein D9758_003500 [Tetrapyrgos nigripes]
MRPSYLPFIFLSVYLSALCAAKIVERAEELPTQDFDFIVIGGGTAGSVVASRLSEDPSVSVLVLEAGPSNEGIQDSIVPAFFPLLSGSEYDWKYTAHLGAAVNNRSVSLVGGRILGGTSSINGMAYTRGSSDDWNRYASVTGDPGWSWDNVQPYFRKNEHFTQPADKHNITGQFDPTVHSFNGTMSVTLSGFLHQMDALAIESSMTSEEWPFNLDFNGGNTLGISWMQSTILNGERSSAATAYLAPNTVQQRPNLHILVNATVTRILPTNASNEEQLAFDGVEFTQDDGETLQTVKGNKEIVLSAGTVGSVKVLLHSGVGPSDSLTNIGITPLHNLPSVGRNLSEQALLPYGFLVNSTDPTATANPTPIPEMLAEWNNSRSGPLVDGALNSIGFGRLPEDSEIYQRFEDTSAGPNGGHFQISFTNGMTAALFGQPANVTGFIPLMVAPASRGFVGLNSSNPLDSPNVQVNLLSNEFDLFTLRYAIRSIQRFIASQPFQDAKFIVGPLVNVTTDEEIDEFIRENVSGALHVVGTNSMSPKGADWGVVDPDLRLKGAKGVRVVDASVLPYVPSASPQVPVYIVAERASDLIKASWNY